MTTQHQKQRWDSLTDGERKVLVACFRESIRIGGGDKVAGLLEYIFGADTLKADNVTSNANADELGQIFVKVEGESVKVEEPTSQQPDLEPVKKRNNAKESETTFASEPEEEVTIEGFVTRDPDGWPRLYSEHINYLVLPRECNIKGEVTITIKAKKK